MLSVNLIKAGVTPEWINPGHPEENGRHERFHKTLKESVANPPAPSFPEQIQRLRAFIDEYNFERPHEALNQEYPGVITSHLQGYGMASCAHQNIMKIPL